MPQSPSDQTNPPAASRSAEPGAAGSEGEPVPPQVLSSTGTPGEDREAASQPADSSRPQAKATSSGTPTKPKRSGRNPTIQNQGAETVQVEMSCKLLGEIVGPMPIQLFLDDFVPLPRLRLSSTEKVPVDYFDEIPMRASATDIKHCGEREW